MRKLSTQPNPKMPASQLHLAKELGISAAHTLDSSALVAAIERQLGDRTALERARWFVMSVLRHEQQASWNDPDQSGLSREHQYDLAGLCLASSDFVQSIKTVLKGDTCKYTLVGFRRTRNTRKLILANTTVAYHCALGILRAAKLLELTARQDSAGSGQAPTQHAVTADATTASVRRASRRGFNADTARQEGQSPLNAPNDNPDVTVAHAAHDSTTARAPGSPPDASLSPQEYAELEQVLSRQATPAPAKKSWLDFGDDESRSWVFGLLAGFAVCAVILLLFL